MESLSPSSEPHASGGKDFSVIRRTFLSTILLIAAIGTNEGLRESNFWSGFETAVFLPTLCAFQDQPRTGPLTPRRYRC